MDVMYLARVGISMVGESFQPQKLKWNFV